MYIAVCRLFLLLLFSSVSYSQAEPLLNVRFATDANYPPFEYLTEDKQIAGFDIDIAKAICEAVKLNCTFEQHRFDGLLLTLSFGRFDAVIAAIDITAERQETVDFTDSYYQSPPVFLSNKQLQGDFSVKGKFIGVLANSSNQDYLNKYTKGDSYIIPYSSSQAALQDLTLNKIDAVFADFAVIHSFLSAYTGETKLLITRTEEVFMAQYSAGYGIAVKKGNEVLRERLNKGLKTIVENGTYGKIYKRYFPLK